MHLNNITVLVPIRKKYTGTGIISCSYIYTPLNIFHSKKKLSLRKGRNIYMCMYTATLENNNLGFSKYLLPLTTFALVYPRKPSALVMLQRKEGK